MFDLSKLRKHFAEKRQKRQNITIGILDFDPVFYLDAHSQQWAHVALASDPSFTSSSGYATILFDTIKNSENSHQINWWDSQGYEQFRNIFEKKSFAFKTKLLGREFLFADELVCLGTRILR